MGNCVGTIHFDPGTINIDDLNNLRDFHKLKSADPTNLDWHENKQSYGVEISGYQILIWYLTSEGAEKAIKSFLRDAEKIWGDRIKTTYRHLPI